MYASAIASVYRVFIALGSKVSKGVKSVKFINNYIQDNGSCEYTQLPIPCITRCQIDGLQVTISSQQIVTGL